MVGPPDSNGSAERSSAEREAARQERERRRAGRRAKKASPAKDLAEQPALSQREAARSAPPQREAAKAALSQREAAQPAGAGAIATQPQREAPKDSLRGGGGGMPALASRPPRRGSGKPHSMRARLVAIGALVAVVLVGWLAVLLIQHLRKSGKPSKPVSTTPVVKVVIPEGETRLQIATIASKDGLTGNYMRASTHNPGITPRRFGAPASIRNLEGFLFPATYEMRVHGNVATLVSQQLEAFQERFGREEEHAARKLGLTAYELLIVASMVEREAFLPHDRPLVASVIYNRLRTGMPLGIDSTLRYALNDWESPLTEAQLKTPSPYNTRLHTGLPPTPISNPGMESILAATHPAKSDYLYYVAGADGCGELVFSNTYAEFERNSTAYQEALRANGGRVPKCKRR